MTVERLIVLQFRHGFYKFLPSPPECPCLPLVLCPSVKPPPGIPLTKEVIDAVNNLRCNEKGRIRVGIQFFIFPTASALSFINKLIAL